MSFYEILVFIHIFSAILGMGPGLVMTVVVAWSKPTNMTEVRQAFKVRDVLHLFTMYGGILLLATGLIMGFLNTHLFTQGWYMTSLILFLIALAMGPFVLKPYTTPIRKILAHEKGEEIPDTYYKTVKKLFRFEDLINLIFLTIIFLMIVKPF